MKSWLDDIRTPPDESWTWVKAVAEAVGFMEAERVTEASLDHDLGMDDDGQELPEGRTLVYWMANESPAIVMAMIERAMSQVRQLAFAVSAPNVSDEELWLSGSSLAHASPAVLACRAAW
jgi:hypothetical protein